MSSRKAAAARKAQPKAPRAVKPSAKPSDTGISAGARELAREVERRIDGGEHDVLSAEALQALTAVICRHYSQQIEAGNDILPLKPQSVAPTEVMVMASGLLRSANLAVFELGMWQSWTGR